MYDVFKNFEIGDEFTDHIAVSVEVVNDRRVFELSSLITRNILY